MKRQRLAMAKPRPKPAVAVVALAISVGVAAAAVGQPCPSEPPADYAEAYRVLSVDSSGGARFTSIQEAVDEATRGDCRARVEIRIAPGRYRERVVIGANDSPLTLRGMGESPRETVVLSGLRSQEPAADGRVHASRRAATLYVGSDDHIFENLTFVNTSVRIFEETGGRPAAKVVGDRIAFSNVAFINWGSDLVASIWGRQYYHRCLFDSRGKGTDFIYGTARAVFDGCRIRVPPRSQVQVAAHARSGRAKVFTSNWAQKVGRSAGPREIRTDGGFVFTGCRVETRPGARVYLGRSWSADGRIAFMNSWLGDGIRPAGWSKKGLSENKRDSYLAEYRNRGPGADTGHRVAWGRQLGSRKARAFRTERFLRDPRGRSDPWLEYVMQLSRSGSPNGG